MPETETATPDPTIHVLAEHKRELKIRAAATYAKLNEVTNEAIDWYLEVTPEQHAELVDMAADTDSSTAEVVGYAIAQYINKSR